MDLDFQYCLEGKTHSIAELPNTDLDICGYFGRVTSHIIIMNILVCFQKTYVLFFLSFSVEYETHSSLYNLRTSYDSHIFHISDFNLSLPVLELWCSCRTTNSRSAFSHSYALQPGLFICFGSSGLLDVVNGSWGLQSFL